MTITKLSRMLWILPFCWLFFAGYVGAATLHTIIVADTNDPEINADKDLANIKAMVNAISGATGLQSNLQVLAEDTISAYGNGYQQVRTTVDQLRSYSDDVVIFYYTGHGVMDWKKAEWPAMELQGVNSPSEQLLRLSRVKEILQQQKPRLLIVMADTCNKVDPIPTRGPAQIILPKIEPGTEAAYQALFLNSQGVIIASAAKRGQKAIGDQKGGYFTQGFLTSLKSELNSPNPSWKMIMANTKNWVQEKESNQTPQAQVAVRVIGNGDDNGDYNNDDLPIIPPVVPPVPTIAKLTVNKFDTNSAKLKPSHQSQLEQWEQASKGAKSLTTAPSIRVEGHTDSKGADEYNRILSKRRASSVKNYLVEELGANPNRLEIISYGENQLIASDETEDGRALNRRVELIPEMPMVVATSSDKMLPTQTTTLADDQHQASLPLTEPLPNVELLKPEIACPEKASSFGSCYWETDNSKDWNVFVEEKLWLNSWQGWELSSGNKHDKYGIGEEGKHLVSILSEHELVSILTLGFRYKKFSLGLTVLPKRAYEFPMFKRQVQWYNKIEEEYEYRDSEEEVLTSAEREEIDITIGYSILPQLTIGAGFKRATVDYTYNHYSDNPFADTPTSNERWSSSEKYKTYGASLNIGGQVCLASWVGANISMFGNFSYGLLKTEWSNGDSDPNIYHSTDLGLAWELPKIQQIKPEIRFGYRAQTMYSEASVGDAVDTAEGFTLGLRVTF